MTKVRLFRFLLYWLDQYWVAFQTNNEDNDKGSIRSRLYQDVIQVYSRLLLHTITMLN
ncbi:hypothetical protein V1503_23605 [Bacillus sp. SCS-151]